MQETEERRALVIAAQLMQEMGCCKYERGSLKCRRTYPTDEDCRRCIKNWLMAKARRELKREQSKKKK